MNNPVDYIGGLPRGGSRLAVSTGFRLDFGVQEIHPEFTKEGFVIAR
jgi:hypothetical protein